MRGKIVKRGRKRTNFVSTGHRWQPLHFYLFYYNFFFYIFKLNPINPFLCLKCKHVYSPSVGTPGDMVGWGQIYVDTALWGIYYKSHVNLTLWRIQKPIPPNTVLCLIQLYQKYDCGPFIVIVSPGSIIFVLIYINCI